jgi:mannose-6-phosphate isomerase-like protein (cupin superfamily)
MSFNVSIEQAVEQLKKEAKNRFTTLMMHGSMRVEYYAPRGIDNQTPHKQDELYIIVSGSGYFLRNNESIEFGPGDVLFVPAGMEHRFESFTDDFATWVIFYGSEGGEKNT